LRPVHGIRTTALADPPMQNGTRLRRRTGNPLETGYLVSRVIRNISCRIVFINSRDDGSTVTAIVVRSVATQA
jgi:hypothetical protein